MKTNGKNFKLTLKQILKLLIIGFIIYSVVILTIIVITCVFLWESFVPGTSFRYYLCKKNAKTEQLVQFRFNPGPYVYNVSQFYSLFLKFS